jgi:transcriptional regulator with XRE-family HTH domain
MFYQLDIKLGMEKSIFSAEQKALQQVLRQFRLGAGLTQEELALQLNVPQSFVSKYESGERRLDLVELRLICTAIGVTLRDLVTRFEEQLRPCNPTGPSSDSPSPSGPTFAP